MFLGNLVTPKPRDVTENVNVAGTTVTVILEIRTPNKKVSTKFYLEIVYCVIFMPDVTGSKLYRA